MNTSDALNWLYNEWVRHISEDDIVRYTGQLSGNIVLQTCPVDLSRLCEGTVWPEVAIIDCLLG